jgi:hypothetical protein
MKRKVMVASSWSPAGEELYGRRWLETAKQYWGDLLEPNVITDDKLAMDFGFRGFMERHAARRLDPSQPGYDYRQDLLRFAHKVFALKIALQEAEEDGFDWLVWLDGDVETKAPITEAFLDVILLDDHDGVLLSRAQSAPHPECGFMAFNLKLKGGDFLRKFVGMYLKDDVLKLSELHDSYVFMVCVIAHMEQEKSNWHDLCSTGGGPYGLDAFEASPLDAFFVHKKGNRKVGMTNAEIVERLLAGRPHVRINPCDFDGEVPEDAVPVIDCDNVPVEDIRRALLAVEDKPLIFIGFYSSDEDGKHIDTSRYGINAVRTDTIAFESVERARDGLGFVHVAVTRDWKDIPDDLPVFHVRQMAQAKKEQIKAITNNSYQTNMLVQTQNCVPEETIRANIVANLAQIPEWVRYSRHHMKRAVIVSAGPSIDLPETMDAIRREVENGSILFCVKHSHNKLIAAGLVPWGCVLLDPRPHEGISTHGKPRAELLPAAYPGVRYFCASMVDPSTVKRLMDTGGKVYGWHAAVGADEKSVLPPEHQKFLMGGGSSSAGRAMILAWQFMGFQSIGLYGFDSCHLDESKLDKDARHQDGTPKYILMDMAAGGRNKRFWTDRDILCQAQDFTRFLQESPWIQWDAHGPGMVAWLWENTRGNLPRLEETYG